MVRPKRLLRYAVHPQVVRVTTSTRRRLGRAWRRTEPELPAITHHVDRFTHVDRHLVAQGWAFSEGSPILAVGIATPSARRLVAGYGRASPDVAEVYGPRARRCRFDVQVPWASPDDAAHGHLYVRLADGREVDLDNAVHESMVEFRFGWLWVDLLHHMQRMGTGRVLELGSRGEAGTIYRNQVPPGWDYVGFDIADGPNVDVVGDAHELSSYVEPESFDALFSIATFEHLAMPWKVAVEINKVLKPGGLAVLVSHQCWPIHEQPWDFWRFSTWAWRAMFNEVSGFEVVEAAMGEPARVVPDLLHPVTSGVARGTAYLGSAAMVRKIGPTSLRWDVPTSAAAEGTYPSLALRGYDASVPRG